MPKRTTKTATPAKKKAATASGSLTDAARSVKEPMRPVASGFAIKTHRRVSR